MKLHYTWIGIVFFVAMASGETVAVQNVKLDNQRPNILWISVEDISPISKY